MESRLAYWFQGFVMGTGMNFSGTFHPRLEPVRANNSDAITHVERVCSQF